MAELSSNNLKIRRLQEEITEFRRAVSEGGTDVGPEMEQMRKASQNCIKQ